MTYRYERSTEKSVSFKIEKSVTVV